MPARTGAELLAGLNDDREIWIGDERVRIQADLSTPNLFDVLGVAPMMGPVRPYCTITAVRSPGRVSSMGRFTGMVSGLPDHVPIDFMDRTTL